MDSYKTEHDFLKAILRVSLTRSELEMLNHFYNKKVKTVVIAIQQLADELKIQRPNASRTINSLKAKGVIGKRADGYFVRSTRAWKMPKK